ncbi:phosphotransferase [Antrihabitans sp. YC3-6]|uniref:Phosphotransferase n=1 Tax=Antrihabitans stalagmiti TaxID=2799499 RepID=A0A934NLF8_9NOCA|nr:phosphotransferase [Antrihabitans stalagmiti]MBJ8337391.1 phosphotransferase [Antrihabitans stalagmiti]
MSALVADRAAGVVAAAEKLLARRMGAPVRLVDPTELGGSGRTVVLRVRVADNTFSLPRTLIVKKVRDFDTTFRAGFEPGVASVDSAFLREAVSYQFATALAIEDRPGPDLLAHDLDERLLIISDLGEGVRLTTQLQSGDDAAAENSLMAFAQALGRMHSTTVGRESDFTALLRRAEVAHHADGVTSQAVTAVERLPGMLDDSLGITVPDAVVDASRHCLRLFRGGRLRAFSPSDLCPDNVIVNDDGVRFLDYEWGGYRDASLDIAYALVSYPGCLCHFDMSDERAQAMIEAWRSEVVGIWPFLADDKILARKMLDAKLIWVWLSTYWFLPDNHARIAAVRTHGLSVPRSEALLSRWASLSESAGVAGDRHLAALAERVAGELDSKWSGED